MAAPTVLTAKKTQRSLVVGSHGHKYEVLHDWPQLPSAIHLADQLTM